MQSCPASKTITSWQPSGTTSMTKCSSGVAWFAFSLKATLSCVWASSLDSQTWNGRERTITAVFSTVICLHPCSPYCSLLCPSSSSLSTTTTSTSSTIKNSRVSGATSSKAYTWTKIMRNVGQPSSILSGSACVAWSLRSSVSWHKTTCCCRFRQLLRLLSSTCAILWYTNPLSWTGSLIWRSWMNCATLFFSTTWSRFLGWCRRLRIGTYSDGLSSSSSPSICLSMWPCLSSKRMGR